MDDKIKALNILNEYKNKLNELDNTYETLNARYGKIDANCKNLCNNFLNVKKPKLLSVISAGLMNFLGVVALPILFFSVPFFVACVAYYVISMKNYKKTIKELESQIIKLNEEKFLISLEKESLKYKRVFIVNNVDDLSKLVYTKDSVSKQQIEIISFAGENLKFLNKIEQENKKEQEKDM